MDKIYDINLRLSKPEIDRLLVLLKKGGGLSEYCLVALIKRQCEVQEG